MKKLLFPMMAILAVSCGKSAEEVAKEKAEEGEKKIARMNEINKATATKYGVSIHISENDANAPVVGAYASKALNASQCKDFESLLKEYISLSSQLEQIIKSKNVKYKGSYTDLKSYQLNAANYLGYTDCKIAEEMELAELDVQRLEDELSENSILMVMSGYDEETGNDLVMVGIKEHTEHSVENYTQAKIALVHFINEIQTNIPHDRRSLNTLRKIGAAQDTLLALDSLIILQEVQNKSVAISEASSNINFMTINEKKEFQLQVRDLVKLLKTHKSLLISTESYNEEELDKTLKAYQLVDETIEESIKHDEQDEALEAAITTTLF